MKPYKMNAEDDDNIARAENVAIQLWKLGWAVICPHKNTAYFEIYEAVAGIPKATWLNGDLEMLKRCDAIFMLHNWQRSAGARIEHDYAVDYDIPVFMEDGAVIPSPKVLI